MEIEKENLRNKILEEIEGCTRCGFCRELCPVLRVLRKESDSPRGKVIALERGLLNRFVYECTLCKACEVNCPFDINIPEAIVQARALAQLEKKVPSRLGEVLRNLEKHGNPFGEK